MNLPTINEQEITNKRVLVRVDLDVPIEDGKVTDDTRIKAATSTIEAIKEKNPQKIIVMGHLGRFEEGKEVPSVDIVKPIIESLWGNVEVLPNLRQTQEEEQNSDEFAKALANQADVYVNDAFAVSHRAHASIVSVPKYLPHAAGIRFIEEVKNLEKVKTQPEHPLIMLISGAKEDKLEYVNIFKQFADKILISGRLPIFLEDVVDEKLEIGKLTADRNDITIKTMENFESIIASARMIVVSGPMGRFEEVGHRQGTQRVLTAIANSNAVKIAGGGDTTNAITMLGLSEKFTWISIGGGAMLDFLANGTLPGIQALLD
jgi:phosphoglycerate kinase